MKFFLVQLLILFSLIVNGQQFTISKINQLLQGTWISDKTGSISRFDTIGKDTDIIRFTQSNFDDCISLKGKTLKCQIVKKNLFADHNIGENTGYSLYSEIENSIVTENSAGERTYSALISIYVIMSISEKHLVLCNSEMYKIVSYTRK